MTRFLAAALLLGALAQAPVHAAPRGERTTLTVRSTPPGAHILVDGAPAGATPRSISGLTPGSHRVELRLEGHRPATREIRLRRRERKTISATLPRVSRVPAAELARRRSAFVWSWGSLRAWSVANRLGMAPPGVVQAQGGGLTGFDPTTRLHFSITEGVDQEGHPALAVSFFLDAELSQPAGSAAVTLGNGLLVDFSFTAGPLEGAAGKLRAALSPGGGAVVTGSGTLGDGTAWTSKYRLTLAGSGIALSGSGDLVSPDGHRARWELQGTESGTDYRVDFEDGSVLRLHVDDEGSGAGDLRSPAGEVLALFSWPPGGPVTVTYPDGTTESFPL